MLNCLICVAILVISVWICVVHSELSVQDVSQYVGRLLDGAATLQQHDCTSSNSSVWDCGSSLDIKVRLAIEVNLVIPSGGWFGWGYEPGEPLKLQWAEGGQLQLRPTELTRNAAQYLEQQSIGAEFTVRQLPGDDWFANLCLVRALASKGVLAVLT